MAIFTELQLAPHPKGRGTHRALTFKVKYLDKLLVRGWLLLMMDQTRGEKYWYTVPFSRTAPRGGVQGGTMTVWCLENSVKKSSTII